MALSKDGGLGLRDPKIIHLKAATKRICRIWMIEGLVQAKLVCMCYIKGGDLGSIEKANCDSALWVNILRLNNTISIVANCDSNYKLCQSTLESIQANLTSLYNTYRTMGDKDPYAQGIWVCKTSKIAIDLSRLRLNKLHSFTLLVDDKTVRHLFIQQVTRSGNVHSKTQTMDPHKP